MMRFIRSLFAWRTAFRAGCYDYQENVVSGRRRARRWCSGHSPLDWGWLLEAHVHRGMPDIDGVPAWRSSERDALPNGMFWG